MLTLSHFNTFAAGSAPAWDRLIDLTLHGRGLAANVLRFCNLKSRLLVFQQNALLLFKWI